MLRCAFYTVHFNKCESNAWPGRKRNGRWRTVEGGGERRAERDGRRGWVGRERGEPYGVAVWEIAGGDGQRARNRWASRGIITGSQKVTMNYSKSAMQPGNTTRKATHSRLFAAGPNSEAPNKRRSLTSGCAGARRAAGV